MPVGDQDHSLPAAEDGRILPGWMEWEEAIRFLTEDCLFDSPLSTSAAAEIWEPFRAIVEKLQFEPVPPLRRPALSEADQKVIRKVRNRHPDTAPPADLIKLNPLDVTLGRLWVSTSAAERYRDRVTPDKWPYTALIDPPATSGVSWVRENDAVFFDLPHGDYWLSDLQPDGHIRLSEADRVVAVALCGDHALLLRGYHRAFACARAVVESANAPRGVLFALSPAPVEGPAKRLANLARPPLMGDFFDERLFLPVKLRTKRYRMRVRYEVSEVEARGGEGRSVDWPALTS